MEISIKDRSNIALASTAPAIPPAIWATVYAPTPFALIPVPVRRPSNQSAADTTGLKCAPDAGPNNSMSVARPNTVAVEF